MLGTTESGQILKLKWGIINAPTFTVKEITELKVFYQFLYIISVAWERQLTMLNCAKES